MTHDEIAEAIDTIEKHFNDRLDDWQAEFIDSISRQHGSGRMLSDKQIDVLKRMIEKFSRDYGR